MCCRYGFSSPRHHFVHRRLFFWVSFRWNEKTNADLRKCLGTALKKRERMLNIRIFGSMRTKNTISLELLSEKYNLSLIKNRRTTAILGLLVLYAEPKYPVIFPRLTDLLSVESHPAKLSSPHFDRNLWCRQNIVRHCRVRSYPSKRDWSSGSAQKDGQ